MNEPGTTRDDVETNRKHAETLARLTRETELACASAAKKQEKIETVSTAKNRRLLSILCHVSVLLNWTVLCIGIPIAILFCNDDPVIRANARESLNVHINLFLWYAVSALLLFVLIGWPMLALGGIYHVVVPTLAILATLAQPDKPFEYPFTLGIVTNRTKQLTSS